MRPASIFVLVPLLVAALAGGLAAAPLTDGAREFRLDNGLRVIIKENRNAPLVYVGAWYDVGFRDETPGIVGSAHLLEHMLFRSTVNFPGGRIKELLTEIGAAANGWTMWESTCYFQTVPSARFELALGIERERMKNAMVDRAEFEKERTIVLSEINNRRASADMALTEKLYAAAFPGRPQGFYSQPLHVDDLKSVTFERMLAFYRTWYVPNNCTVVIVGDVDAGAALERVKALFGPVPRGELPARRPHRAAARPAGEVRVTGLAPAPYGKILFHAPGLDLADRDSVVLRFLAWTGAVGALGYDAFVDDSVVTLGFPESGPIYPADTFDEALVARELPRFKDQLAARERRSYQTLQDQASGLGYLARRGALAEYDRLLAAMQTVTAAEVAGVVKRYLHKGNAVTGYLAPSRRTPRASAPADLSLKDDHTKGASLSVLKEGTAGELARYRRDLADIARGMGEALDRFHAGIDDFTLPNGLRVVLRENTQSDQVAIRLLVPAGQAFDSPSRPGLADLVRGLAFDGGPAIRDRHRLAREGAAFKSGTDFDYALFLVDGFAAQLPRLLSVVGRAVAGRTFHEAVVRAEVNDLRRAADRFESVDNLRAHASRLVERAFYPAGHPVRALADAGPDGFGNITPADAAAFYDRHYQARGSVLVVVGNFRRADARREVAAALGGWKRGTPPAYPRLPETANPAKTVVLKKTVPGKPQSIIILAQKGLRFDAPDYAATMLMSSVVGSGGFLQSRVAKAIREEMAASYAAYLYFGFSRASCDAHGYIQAAPADVDRVLAALVRELDRVRRDGIFEKELLLAKISLLARYAYVLETPAQQAIQLAWVTAFRDDPRFLSTSVERYRAVSKSEVDKSARTYFDPRRFVIGIAGDGK